MSYSLQSVHFLVGHKRRSRIRHRCEAFFLCSFHFEAITSDFNKLNKHVVRDISKTKLNRVYGRVLITFKVNFDEELTT